MNSIKETNERLLCNKLRLIIGGKLKSVCLCLWIVLLLMLSSCSQAISQPNASIEEINEWQTSFGIELDSEKIYQENIHLFDYDQQIPLDIVEVGSWKEEDVTYADITYASPKGGRVPATLIEPPGSGPFAGVIIQHGLPSNRQAVYEIGKLYADMGAVVIVIDAPFARPENENRSPLLFTEQDREDHIQLIVDLRRAIDLLVTRQNVDPNRLGYIGVSYGGMTGGLLAGVENRLKAYVLVVGDGGLVNHHMIEIEDRITITPLDELTEEEKKQWIDIMWPIESIHYIGHAKPAALLFQNGIKDDLVPSYLALDYQNAGSDPKTVKWYESGHFLPFEHVLDQLKWMSQYIGITNVRDLPSVNLILMGPAEDFILFNSHLRTTAIVIDRLMLIWFVLVVGPFLYLAWDLWSKSKVSKGAKLNWLLAVLFFGPLGLWAYFLSYRKDALSDSSSTMIRSRAISSTVWGVAGNLVGMIGAIGIFEAYSEIYNSFLLIFLFVVGLPLLTGWVINRVAHLGYKQYLKNKITSRRSFLSELVSTNLVLAGGMPVFAILIDKWLFRWYPSGWNLSSPPFWAIASIVACVGAITSYPAHLWMIRPRIIEWGVFPPSGNLQKVKPKPSKLKVWSVVFISYIFLFVCFGLTFGVILQ
jgi:cephalosporin-C deacetylase-like acetyl esterase